MSAEEMEALVQAENLYNWDGFGTLSDIITDEFDITAVPQTDEE